MSRKVQAAFFLASLAVVCAASSAPAQSVSLFSEDFESLVLGPIVTFDSELRENEAWTETPPAGWTVDESGVPTIGNPDTGVTEYEGWSFVSRDWWIASAGDQTRSQFIGGSGIIAVADPDEWDDFGTPGPSSISSPPDFTNPSFPNGYDAKLSTPSIDLSSAPSGEDVKVFFNSSWRPEVLQKATLTATFNDVQTTQYELLRYESEQTLEDESPNPFYKEDAQNEGVLIPLVDDTANGGSDFSVPVGATSMSLEFRLFDAGNNWWWAFDNIQVFTGDAPPVVGTLKAVVDRDTNNVKIVNETDSPVDLRGYSIVSGVGAFDEENANFLAPADNWLQATNLGDESNDLSEVNLTSDTIGAGEEINLGNVWRKFYRDESDISFEYLVVGQDTPIPGVLQVVGNSVEVEPGEFEDQPFDFLDLNYDGEIDIQDWETFKDGFGKDLTGLTQAQRYNLSDLDNDDRHTSEDFLIFQTTFDAANGPGAFALALASAEVPEPTSLAIFGLACFGTLVTRRRTVAAVIALPLLFGLCGTADAQLTLFSEDFEGANVTNALGPFQEEDVQGQEVWTNSIPGWNNVNANDDVPGIHGYVQPDPLNPIPLEDRDGVSDWSDWAFVKKDAWISAADQGRSGFTRASGNLLVADSDEWDDADGTARDPAAQDPTPDNLFDIFVTTPVISIPSGIPAGRIKLSFDSSWRGNEFQDDLDNENNESAQINVSYNGGSFQEVFRRESDPESDFYNPNQENERVSQVDLIYDGVATELQLEFGYTDAWNDWWWAIDNIEVSVPANPLKLRINTFNGRATLVGDDEISTSINYLAIESENGVLTGDSASGLTGAGLAPIDGPDLGDIAGDSLGEQWESLTDSQTQDTLIAEAFLFGDTAFDDTDEINLGFVFNPSTLEADRDVTFNYTTNTGDTINPPVGNVEYYFEIEGLPGDFNGDNSVDAADYAVWRNGLGTTYGPGDYTLWRNNYGATHPVSSGASVPEPFGLGLLAVTAAGLFSARRLRSASSMVALLMGLALFGSQADAQVTLDRDYQFGDEAGEGAVSGAVVGSGASNGATFDSAGQTGMNQLIDLLPKGPNAFAQPKYTDVNDRPDMLPSSNVVAPAGLGVALNPFPEGSTFNQQYLHTGFEEALNFPERSPSSTFSQGGTINYDLISDRGFQLWVKPTAIRESHIVMDTNQHGVLINADGEFAMRYAFSQETIDNLATNTGQPASDFADIFDYSSGVAAQADTWYHLSVVRPFGPGNGSILYVDGKALAATTGEYNVEVVVNDDFGEPILDDLDTSPLVIGANTGNPTYGTEKYFSGVVDDLEMFVMGINADNFFPDYHFEDDNQYALAFKPTTDGDLDGDDDIDLTDAQEFADNWLYRNRVFWTDLNGDEQFLQVGDLESRAKGDFNYDGVVDLADWAVLNNANPTMAAAAIRLIQSGTVPEPVGAALFVVAALVGFAPGRGMRSR